MEYKVKVVTNEPAGKTYETLDDQINADLIQALSKEEWVYKQEGAMLERVGYLLGRGGLKSTVSISHPMYGTRKVPAVVPGIPQGYINIDKIKESVRRNGGASIDLEMVYDIRQRRGGLPSYIKNSFIVIISKRVSEYGSLEIESIKGKTEEEALQNPSIQRIFAQGPKTKQEAAIQDYFYLKRPKIEGVEYEITGNRVAVSSPGTIYVDIKPYTKREKKEILNNRAKAVKLAKELGVSISYKYKYKQVIEDKWVDYETDIKETEEMYKEIGRRWVTIRDKRGIHLGTRNDKYLEDVTKLVWDYEKRARGVIREIESVARTIEDTLRKLEELKEYGDGTWGISKVYL